MNNLKFLTGICLTAQLFLLSACSSDEPVQPNAEFKTTPSMLNKHITDLSGKNIPDGGWFPYLQITSPEYPEETLMVLSRYDVMEIPGKGGLYDFETGTDMMLNKIMIYEDIPFLTHNASEYDSPLGEFDKYTEILRTRSYAEANISANAIIDGSPSTFGTLENSILREDAFAFSYTFPENHSGKYRLIVLEYSYLCSPDLQSPFIRVTTSNYFIQMPD